MNQQQDQQPSTRRGGVYTAEIDGRHYDVGGNIATRSIPPGGESSPSRHITTPHPHPGLREHGWRLEWIFLSLLALAGCGLGGVAYAVLITLF